MRELAVIVLDDDEFEDVEDVEDVEGEPVSARLYVAVFTVVALLFWVLLLAVFGSSLKLSAFMVATVLCSVPAIRRKCASGRGEE